MTWIVDTCVLIDVLDDDPAFGRASALCLSERLASGLAICPVTYIELSPAFSGSTARQDEFLRGAGVRHDEPWTTADTHEAHAAWQRHIARRRARQAARRPVADALIGAFACRFEGLITRDRSDFERVFPGLEIVAPG